MSDPRLLTILLNYKTPEMTLRAAEAVRAAMEGIDGEMIIVDNDSKDGSFEEILGQVTKLGWDKDGLVRVIQSGHNGGFGAGNNVGIRSGLSDGTRPDYLYIVNSDAFPAPNAIRLLLDHLEATPKAGFAGSYIYGEDGDPHLTSFRFPSIASEFEGAINFGPVSRLLADKAVPVAIPTETQPVDWLAGASLMMRESVLSEIGVFDETFFLYFEETDLCRRAAQAGYRTDYVRSSEVMHIGSASTGMKTWKRVPEYWYDSRLHYFVKNHGALYASAATFVHLLGGFLHWLRCLITRKDRGVSPYFLSTLLWHDLRAFFRAALNLNKRADTANPVVGE
ncbi:glycosyltransferase family 2 protein [Ruegeria arenilitoris]|uniref:glycosyltransferase family 2 protein n=1 Tax=Ruegeria arenilitoris TaxID=1173585 RepID=UPI00147D0C57|nr:glycosyltransferase family 2 protein [Ruegeria arenilitoris]